MTHTPGPWKDGISPFGNHRRICEMVGGEPGRVIATAHGDVGEVASNARLIAAAPALLAACEAMIRSHAPTINGLCKICHHYGDDCEANQARAAIRAAKGE